jgi:hypothetical protein
MNEQEDKEIAKIAKTIKNIVNLRAYRTNYLESEFEETLNRLKKDAEDCMRGAASSSYSEFHRGRLEAYEKVKELLGNRRIAKT